MSNPPNSTHKILLRSVLLLLCVSLVGLIVSRYASASVIAMLPRIATIAAFQISGRITNQSGSPLPNTVVEIIDPSNNRTIASTTTSTNGTYSLAVEGGTYSIKVIAPAGSELQSAIAPNQIITGATTLDFILVPGSLVTFSGRLLDPLGNGIPNQRIGLAPVRTSNYFYITTDAAGNYSFLRSPGTYTLRLENFTSPNTEVNVPPRYFLDSDPLSLTQSLVKADIILPMKRVSVRVQDAAGNPVSDVAMTTSDPISRPNLNLNNLPVVGRSSYPDSSTTLKTNARGEVMLWLFPNTYIITATPPSGSNFQVTNLHNVVATSDISRTITLTIPVTLSGRLLDALGGGLANQRIYIAPENASFFEFKNTLTDQQGSYSFQVSSGNYNLYITDNSNAENAPRSYSISLATPIQLLQSRVLDLPLPLKRINLRIQDQRGNAVPNALLVTPSRFNPALPLGLLSARGNSGYPTYDQPVKTNSSGDATLWLFPNETGRTYNLTIIPPADSNLPITTLSDFFINADRSQTINLTSAVTLSGRVLDPLGQPVARQQVQIAPQGDINYALPFNYAEVATNALGEFSFLLSPGNYDLRISGAVSSQNAPQFYRFSSKTGLAIIQNRAIDITLPTKRIVVEVKDPQGFPVPDVRLSTTRPYAPNLTLGTLPADGESETTQTTNLNGRATLWLFPGVYTITATPAAGTPFAPFSLENRNITSDENIVVFFNINHPPPLTTATVTSTPISPGIYQDPATVALSATAAPGFAIATTGYSVDGGATQTYTAPFTVSGAGTHTVKYHSVDNSGVVEADKTLSLTLASKQTQTTIKSSANPSAFGQSVTFTATVSAAMGTGTPTGTATFRDGSTALVTVSLTAGVATFSTTTLAAGTRSITAVYNGDSNFNSSTSAALTQIVRPTTTTAVRASVNPSTFRQPVTLTANITSPATGTPTGTVTWLDRGVSLGNSALSNGTATLTTSALAAGVHSITAIYQGDSNFLPSASAVLLHTVKPPFAPCEGASFGVVGTYAVGAKPYGTATGSFNTPGRLDLAVANRDGNTVSLLSNTGTAFQLQRTLSAGTNPSAVAVGDFNADGRADLAVANETSNNVSLLLGSGNGQFQSAMNYPIGSGARAIVVGDFNRDGKLDLATANFGSSNLSVLLGNGNGTFQTATNYLAGQNAISLAQGDFNGDGNVDLAVANYSANNVSLFLGKGDGTFLSPTNFAVGANPHSVAAGDFNGDGRLDLVVANYESHTVSVLLGNGNGMFQSAANPIVGLRPVYVAVGDLNGDGNVDLAVANYLSNDVSLLLGKGDGTFPSAQTVKVETKPRSLVIEDLDGDGTLDLAVSNEDSNTVSILRNSCGRADLLLTHHVFPNTVMVGQQVTYTLRVTNLGPGTATGVTVTDNLPATTTFAFCDPNSQCSGTGNNRTVTFASLAAGATATATITANVTGQLNDGAVISHSASVTSMIFDPDDSNNKGEATFTIKGVTQASLTLDGGKSGFDFAPLIVRPEPPTIPPSDAFTIANNGNAPLVLNFTSILRTGMNVDGQRISNADDRRFYSMRAINADSTETPIGMGTTRTINSGQTQRFRVLYMPTRPPVADSTRNLPASLVLQDANTSTLTISQNGGAPLTVNLIGRIDPKVQLLPPALLRRTGSDLVVEAAVYDANLNTSLMRFQFLDNAGNAVETREVVLYPYIAQSTVVTGQSFIVEQRFPGLASNANIANVRVTVVDGDGGSDTATSGATTQAIAALANVSAASYSEEIASEAVASAFGSGLATTSLAALSVPLPTALAGTSVKLKDSLGAERLAPLFYVSPTQVNYLIPAGTAPGLAMVTITSSDGKVAMGATNIAWVAPSLFSANSNGQGVAAAAIQRVRADGTQSYETVAAFDSTQNKFIATPINLGAATEQVFVTLFGTGIRHNSSLAAVKAQVGGVDAPVVYAGAQGGYVGLDQVNVLLPRSLLGRGEVEVKLWVDYQATNTVKINIR